MTTFNVLNRQITGAGHNREASSAKSRGQVPAINQAGSVLFFEENKEELAAAIARIKSSRVLRKQQDKMSGRRSAQRDYIDQIKKMPDLEGDSLKGFKQDLMIDDKELKDSDISAKLKRRGIADPTHVYLALRYAKEELAEDLKKFAVSDNIQARSLYINRLTSIELYIQNYMEKFGEHIFAGLNSGEEQAAFSEMGLGTPQVLRDYYRSIIKDHKSVLAIYKDIIDSHGVNNFSNRCDFLMKFVSRHLETIKGKYDSVKLELMHREIHLLRIVQSELVRIGEYFGQFTRATGDEFNKFQHKVFEHILGMVEATSVREPQVDGLTRLCSVTDPKEKISVVNNLIACVSDMPETLFTNITARVKIRMMIYIVSEKLMAKANESIEEFSKAALYYKAGGFKANAADPALESIKVAAYFPEGIELAQNAVDESSVFKAGDLSGKV